jgi:hypothetical protein
MARKNTPTFIAELLLSVAAGDEREALVRLELARQLYNACLGESLRRLDLMRESLAWARAKAMPKIVGKKPNKERHAAFAAVRHAHGFTSESISAFGTKCKNDARWNAERARTDPRLGAHETQTIAERAYSSVEMYAFGVRGRPRFKGKGRPMHSIEGKSAGSGLCWNAGAGCLEWGALRLFAQLAPDGKDSWMEEALDPKKHRTKFARIVWRTVKGQRRWFVQLAQEGLAPLKYHSVDGAIVGLDVGPSTVAVYSEQGADLVPLAPEVAQPRGAGPRRPRAQGGLPHGASSARWIVRVGRRTRSASVPTGHGSAAPRSKSAPPPTRSCARTWPRLSVSSRSAATVLTAAWPTESSALATSSSPRN